MWCMPCVVLKNLSVSDNVLWIPSTPSQPYQVDTDVLLIQYGRFSSIFYCWRQKIFLFYSFFYIVDIVTYRKIILILFFRQKTWILGKRNFLSRLCFVVTVIRLRLVKARTKRRISKKLFSKFNWGFKTDNKIGYSKKLKSRKSRTNKVFSTLSSFFIIQSWKTEYNYSK